MPLPIVSDYCPAECAEVDVDDLRVNPDDEGDEAEEGAVVASRTRAHHPAPDWKTMPRAKVRTLVEKHVKHLNDVLARDLADRSSLTRKGRPPLVVAYGLGVDSTAMLVGLHQRGIVPDLILFADTGGEKPSTYAYLPVIQRWLKKVGFPPVVVVRNTSKTRHNRRRKDGLYVAYDQGREVKVPKGTEYTTLEQNLLIYRTLPGVVYGKGTCAAKWKIAPQNRYVASWAPAQRAWAKGQRVIKLIGYDGGPADARRGLVIPKRDDTFWSKWTGKEDPCLPNESASLGDFLYRYPLREWGWDRQRCVTEIAKAGLPVPPKSACFYCGASKPSEVVWLAESQPDLAQRIVDIEDGYRTGPNFRSERGMIKGLWGREHVASEQQKATAKRLAQLADKLEAAGEEYATFPVDARGKPMWQRAQRDGVKMSKREREDAVLVEVAAMREAVQNLTTGKRPPCMTDVIDLYWTLRDKGEIAPATEPRPEESDFSTAFGA